MVELRILNNEKRFEIASKVMNVLRQTKQST